MYYLYADITDDGRVFYIGKGRWHRACKDLKRNTRHRQVAEKYGQNRHVLWWDWDEKWILKLERDLITYMGLNYKKNPMNEIACNLTDGG